MRYRASSLSALAEREQLHGLLQVNSPREWLVLAALAVLTAAAAAWLFAGTVERAVVARCSLIPLGSRQAVMAGVSGTVAAVPVALGDRVAPGAVLARVRQPDVDRELRIARGRLERAAAQPAGRGTGTRIDAARAAVADLEAQAAEGGLVVTPAAGVVEFLPLAPGEAVTAEAVVAQILEDAGGGLEAVAFPPAAAAAAITRNQPAHVTFTGLPGGARTRSGPVSAVSGVLPAPPAWARRAGFSAGRADAADAGRLVRVPLPTPRTGGGALRDASCTLRIVTARHAPIRFLLRGGAAGSP